MSTKQEVRRCPVCKGAPDHPQDTAIQGSPSLCRESFHAPSQRQPSPDWIAKAAKEAVLSLTENERAFLVLTVTREIDDYESDGGNEGSYLAAKSLELKLLAIERNAK